MIRFLILGLALLSATPAFSQGKPRLDSLVVSNLGAFTSNHLFNLQHLQVAPLDYASANINRVSGVSGGTSGSLNSALRVLNTVSNSGAYNATTNPSGRGPGYDGKSYEWGAGFLLDNGRTFLADGFRGQNGAAYFRGRKITAGAGGTWGINVISEGFPGLSNPTELEQAIEADVHADGTDNNGVRVANSAFMKSLSTRDNVPAGYGEGTYAYVALPDPGLGAITSRQWFAKWKKGFTAVGPMDVAFDASLTASNDPANPYKTTDGTSILNPNADTPIAFRSQARQRWCLTADDGFCLRSTASGTLGWATLIGGTIADRMQIDAFGNSAFGTGAPMLLLANYTTQSLFNSGGSTMHRQYNGSVDTRMGAESAGGGFSYVGTTSAHPFLLNANNIEGARITANSRLSEPSRPPASSTSACTIGEHAWDGNFEYRCVTNNTWKRAALSSF